MRKRVFELARELEMSSKELLVELKRMGAEAANHMIQLDDATVEQLLRRLGKAPKDESGHDPFAGLKPGKRILIKKAKPEPLPEPEAALKPETPAPAMDLEAIVEPLPVEAEPVLPESPLHAPVAMESEAAVAPVPEPPPALVLPPPVPAPIVPIVPEAVKAGVKEKPKKARKGGEEEPFGAHRWKDFKAIPKKEKRLRALSPERRGKGGLAGETTKPRKKVIRLHEGITVKEFAELIGIKGGEVIAKLMEMGNLCTINQSMDSDAAVLIADHYGLKVEMTLDRGEEEFEEMPDTEEVLSPRSPVVTVMGHVDHGKTSLLDAIRKTRVTEQESGGITQHIGAYSVRVNERSVVFLDTPGHEAFTAMRARGAKVTDIVVLVVAADDGVMPQTVEAINHAKAAGVPIIVAINKIDKPGSAPERIRQELTKYELVPEAWGGQTIFSEVSAKKQIGLDHLLEMILLQADVLELKANPEKRARGAILEAKLDRGRGPVATVLVQSGTLRVGDPFVCGSHFGKVRMLINDAGKPVKEVPPSSPVEVVGLAGVPQAGDSFMVVEDEKTARTIASQRMQRQRMADMEKARKMTLADLYSQIKEGVVRELNLIVKADVQGSAEALNEALEKLSCEAVKVRIIHANTGGITETDVMLASASNAIIIGFNVRPESKAHVLAERERVDIRHYNVIYDAVADVKAAMEGLLEPTLEERVLGRAEVRQVFPIVKAGTICGSYVTDGVISRASSGVRVLRDSVVVYQGRLASLRRFKDDVRDVQTGYECGIGIENFNDVKVGDVIEAFAIEKVPTKLEG